MNMVLMVSRMYKFKCAIRLSSCSQLQILEEKEKMSRQRVLREALILLYQKL